MSVLKRSVSVWPYSSFNSWNYYLSESKTLFKASTLPSRDSNKASWSLISPCFILITRSSSMLKSCSFFSKYVLWFSSYKMKIMMLLLSVTLWSIVLPSKQAYDCTRSSSSLSSYCSDAHCQSWTPSHLRDTLYRCWLLLQPVQSSWFWYPDGF